jgi:hypothetical protein
MQTVLHQMMYLKEKILEFPWKSYVVSFGNTIYMNMKVLQYPEYLYLIFILMWVYLFCEQFILYMAHLGLQKKMNALQEDNKKIRSLWEEKMNKEEYRSEAKYHEGIRSIRSQYDDMLNHTLQMREKISKQDEFRKKIRSQMKTMDNEITLLKRSFSIQEEVNQGLRRDLSIQKGRITKLRTHVDRHLFEEDDEGDFVDVSE